MRGYIRRIITEPGAESAQQFSRRVRVLAVTYAILFSASLAGVALLAWQGKLFVTLAQRSNVETLTIVFMLLFYGYFAVVSRRGAGGAMRIALWHLRAKRSGDPIEARRRQLAGLGDREDGPYAALDNVLERSDGAPLRFELRDEAGDQGVVEVDGARVRQLRALRGGSADLIAYFVRQLSAVVGHELTVVAWGQIDDDDTERYLAQVEFARRLSRHLGAEQLWPCVVITPEQCAEVERRLVEICPALLDDALLPDWEYSAEHKLPVIPEPLGFVSLSRSARRADPLATMGFATIVVLVTLGVVVLFILSPPWVPG